MSILDLKELFKGYFKLFLGEEAYQPLENSHAPQLHHSIFLPNIALPKVYKYEKY